MENETFVDIPEYEGLYQVSNLGRVRALTLRGNYRYLKGNNKNEHRYGRVFVFYDSEHNKKQIYLRNLLYKCFIGPLLENEKVINIDGDVLNNKLDNLRKATPDEPIYYAKSKKILGRSTAVLQKQILDDKSNDYDYIATKYNVCHETVRRLKTGQTTPLYKKPSKTNLTKMQVAILKFIKTFQETHGGFSPTLQEIANYFNKTKNFAHINVKEMKRKGYIAYEANKARTITIIRELEN